jgi:hypothetical protein
LKARLLLGGLLLIFTEQTFAQRWDVGAWFGGANYFGDLNTHTSFRFTNPGGGLFARYNFDNRVSIRFNVNAGHVWADDQYSSDYYEWTRNLGFSSYLYEAGGQFEFNFMPYDNSFTNSYAEKHNYSPYIFAGWSIFHFNPTAKYNGERVQLQPLGTEGQGYPQYPDLKKYKRTSSAFVFGGGIKFRASKKLGVQIEGGVRKTYTDYLDDVSGVYADPIVLLHEGGEMVAFLADPSSAVVSEPVGAAGKMRGDNSKSDDYFLFGVGFIYTLKSYKCPYQK